METYSIMSLDCLNSLNKPFGFRESVIIALDSNQIFIRRKSWPKSLYIQLMTNENCENSFLSKEVNITENGDVFIMSNAKLKEAIDINDAIAEDWYVYRAMIC